MCSLNPFALRNVTVLLLLGCGFVFCQQNANATCGDYLQMSDGHGEIIESVLRDDYSLESEVPKPPRRCNGPGCSQSPIAPIHQVVPTLKTPPIKALVVIVGSEDDDLVVCKPTFAIHFLQSFGLSSDIFRPPRVESGFC